MGAVCDKCNNYFATHLEQPMMASSEISYLRFNQQLRNKKGRAPLAYVFFGRHAVKARREGKLQFSFEAEDYKIIQKYLVGESSKRMIIPVSGLPPSDDITSRWLAKMALEFLAHKWLAIEDWNRYIIEHDGLDPIRKYAREPKPNETWTFSKRRIYDENAIKASLDGLHAQMIFECDILATGTAEASEFYFVIAVFGMEYAINFGGNSMDGYYHWLEKHNEASPLNIGKNAGF